MTCYLQHNGIKLMSIFFVPVGVFNNNLTIWYPVRVLLTVVRESMWHPKDVSNFLLVLCH
ncbi:hypothetical protein NMG60_11025816 [Bertholletia excelsa]